MLLDSEPFPTLVFLEAAGLDSDLSADRGHGIPGYSIPSSEVANEVIGEAGQEGQY